MKPSEIEVGKTYCNNRRGTTLRKVIGIGPEYEPTVRYSNSPTLYKYAGTGVEFIDHNGRVGRLYMDSFARWAGREVGGLVITESEKYKFKR